MGKRKSEVLSKNKVKEKKIFRLPYSVFLGLLLLSFVTAEAWVRNVGGDDWRSNLLGLPYSRSESDVQVLGDVDTLEEATAEIEYWEEVLILQPTYVPGILKLAVYYDELGESEKAKVYWERAYDLDANGDDVERVREYLGI